MAKLLTKHLLPNTKYRFAHVVCFIVSLLLLAQFLRSGA
jgi:hypothetical protein